ILVPILECYVHYNFRNRGCRILGKEKTEGKSFHFTFQNVFRVNNYGNGIFLYDRSRCPIYQRWCFSNVLVSLGISFPHYWGALSITSSTFLYYKIGSAKICFLNDGCIFCNDRFWK